VSGTRVRRIGYMRIKEIRGLLRIEEVPISREEALKILRGERAHKSEAGDKA